MARVSTRQWAQDCGYDSQKLFQKFFNDDITYLLSMHNLWKNRKPPMPLDWNNLPDAGTLLKNTSVLKKIVIKFCNDGQLFVIQLPQVAALSKMKAQYS